MAHIVNKHTNTTASRIILPPSSEPTIVSEALYATQSDLLRSHAKVRIADQYKKHSVPPCLRASVVDVYSVTAPARMLK
jgi:hypothetical protein